MTVFALFFKPDLHSCSCKSSQNCLARSMTFQAGKVFPRTLSKRFWACPACHAQTEPCKIVLFLIPTEETLLTFLTFLLFKKSWTGVSEMVDSFLNPFKCLTGPDLRFNSWNIYPFIYLLSTPFGRPEPIGATGERRRAKIWYKILIKTVFL